MNNLIDKLAFTAIILAMSTLPIRFERAKPEDAAGLVEVQTRAFDQDEQRFSGRPRGGPPGYDSQDWQHWAMAKGIYYKILAGDRIVGGIVLFDMRNRHFNVGRLFVDPEYQNRGIGTHALAFVEQAHPHVRRWTLDTPDWATRNHHFYRKAGYTAVGADQPQDLPFALTLYEKRLAP